MSAAAAGAGAHERRRRRAASRHAPAQRRRAAARVAHRGRRTAHADSDARAGCDCAVRARSRRAMSSCSPFLLVFPFVATPFFTFQIGAQSLALGLIALSLTFLGGYGGMVSLAQMTVAGIAGYAVGDPRHQQQRPRSASNWPWWVAVPLALADRDVVRRRFIGWLSVRTEGIYTIMITLAIGVAFYYLCCRTTACSTASRACSEVYPPTVFGIDWREPLPFYFLALFCVAGGLLLRQVRCVRAPFGIALQGIRDNPRRMNALGFHVIAHRVAAYARGRRRSPRSAACCSSGTTA